MKSYDLNFSFLVFLFWRLALFTFLILAVTLIPKENSFLGGGVVNYSANPYFWSWINFDGEHYLSIALQGYKDLTYFYFPLYPIAARYLSNLLGGSFRALSFSGLLISNLSFLLALAGLTKLLVLDYKTNVVILTIFLILLFPTSFYFGSFYTESLFLTLVVWSFYFARKGKWLIACMLAGFASATRLIGIILLPALITEYFLASKPKVKFSFVGPNLIFFLLAPLGLIIYMYYLKVKTGDPLEFLHTIDIFGQQRSESIIFLPRVFYRYVFKILPSVNFKYFPVSFTTLLEFFTGILFLILSILSFFKLRLSYAVYLILGYLVPTFSGSFSSMPRYALVLFPGFLLISIYIKKLKPTYLIIIYITLFICLGIATALFTRGYWIS